MRAQSVVAALLFVALHSPLYGSTPQDVAADALRDAVAARLATAPSDVRPILQSYYLTRDRQPVWVADGLATPQARAMIAKLQSARWKGLEPEDYGADRLGPLIQQLEASGDAAEIAAVDVALTAALVRFVVDLHAGRVNPARATVAAGMPLATIVDDVAASCDVSGTLDAWEPRYDGYRRLLATYAGYLRMTEAGDQQPLTVRQETVVPGQRYGEAVALATFLRRVGDLAEDATLTRGVYDGALVEAVKRFQRRHGLDADGRIGKATFAALNVPLSARVASMKWTLERWRWAPRGIEPPSVVVNIPEFRLRGIARDGTRIAMKVIVGEAYKHETPVFSADMRHVVFRPYWNVPWSIQHRELVPKIARDHGYVARNGYEIVDGGRVVPVNGATVGGLATGRYQLRQKPGSSNSLGLVKFLLPNPENVYLHGTPSQHLFSHAKRDFSHGCVRVEDPVALAEFVLREMPEWTRDRILAAMQHGGPTQVDLVEPLPVLIVYGTVVVSRDGAVGVFNDVYGHDRELGAAWQRESERRALQASDIR